MRLTSFSNLKRKPAIGIAMASIVLVVYIGVLVISNWRGQMALYESSLKSYRSDVEKRAMSLGYFFSERKYDLRTMASSRELYAYYTNKALGMSEQYGLRANLFSVFQLFNKTVNEKLIQKRRIYQRLLLVDLKGTPVVDTSPQEHWTPSILHLAEAAVNKKEAFVHIEKANDAFQILLICPCFYKGQLTGDLIAWLDLGSLFSLFVDSEKQTIEKSFELVTRDGCLLCSNSHKERLFSKAVTPAQINRISRTDFSSLILPEGSELPRKMLATIVPIENIPLDFFARLPRDGISGAFEPWHLLGGTGALAVVILLGIGMWVRINMQNLLLKTRFDESKRQQEILALKNRQLKEESEKRHLAEKELEAQRAVKMRSDRLRSLGEMAAGIAHELNQPLVGVRGIAELILYSIETGEPLQQRQMEKHARLIVEQADRMVHIIQHVRLFAREAGKAATALVDLSNIVRSGTGLFAAQFNSRGFRLEYRLDPQPITVKVNQYSMEEVIFNLLSNARDALEKRKKEADPGYQPQVWIRTWRHRKDGEDTARLAIRDNGSGISSDVLPNIFDPFFSTKQPDKGTGLGLSICKAIVNEFGGDIHCISSEGDNTEFIIDLPLCH